MKIYKKIYSSTLPSTIDMRPSKVYVASNIEEINRVFEGQKEKSYCYTLIEYDKDEYLIKIQNDFSNLQEELQAAKIMLGVE